MEVNEQEKIKYEYQILRYQPDQVKGEFLNIGIAVYSKDQNFLQFFAHLFRDRIKHFYPRAERGHFNEFIMNMRKGFEIKKMEGGLFDNLEEITSSVLSRDDSSIYFTETRFALDFDLDSATQDMFARLVL